MSGPGTAPLSGAASSRRRVRSAWAARARSSSPARPASLLRPFRRLPPSVLGEVLLDQADPGPDRVRPEFDRDRRRAAGGEMFLELPLRDVALQRLALVTDRARVAEPVPPRRRAFRGVLSDRGDREFHVAALDLGRASQERLDPARGSVPGSRPALSPQPGPSPPPAFRRTGRDRASPWRLRGMAWRRPGGIGRAVPERAAWTVRVWLKGRRRGPVRRRRVPRAGPGGSRAWRGFAPGRRRPACARTRRWCRTSVSAAMSGEASGPDELARLADDPGGVLCHVGVDAPASGGGAVGPGVGEEPVVERVELRLRGAFARTLSGFLLGARRGLRSAAVRC